MGNRYRGQLRKSSQDDVRTAERYEISNSTLWLRKIRYTNITKNRKAKSKASITTTFKLNISFQLNLATNK